jgi:hypothetical protein
MGFFMCGDVMDKKTRLTADEFRQDVRPRLFGFSEKVVALAELFFVEGKPITEAGEVCGMSKQSASQNISRVLAVLNDVPKDWVYYEGYMPPALAKEIRVKVDALLPKE